MSSACKRLQCQHGIEGVQLSAYKFHEETYVFRSTVYATEKKNQRYNHKSEISANELSLAQAGIRACVGHL